MRGPLAALALMVACLTLLVAMGVVFVVSRIEAHAPVDLYPHLVAQVLAFGSGLPIAFAGALEAYSRDRSEGVHNLLRESGFDDRGYFRTRALGLFGALFMVVGGGTLLSGVVSAMFARTPKLLGQTAIATMGALMFAVSFSLLVGSVALATLAPRGKRMGYIAFALTFLALELLGPWFSMWLPLDFGQIISLRIAFDKVRTGVLPGHDFGEGLRAFILIAMVSFVALTIARAELLRFERQRAR